MDYKELHQQTFEQCKRYVEAFCEIMGCSPSDFYFVGDDPFGPVAIGDEFWSMSDIQCVMSRCDKWIEKYGESLYDVIMEWYWYANAVHEKNYDRIEKRRWRKVDEEPEPNQDVLIRYADGDIFHAIYHDGEFCNLWEEDCEYKTPDYWKPLCLDDEEDKPINLKSWLMGWRPDIDQRKETIS